MLKITTYKALKSKIRKFEVPISSKSAMERAYTSADMIALPRWERTKGPSSGRPESRGAVRSGLQKNLTGFGSSGNLHSPADNAKAVSAR